ncbi:hypothetical protein TYRP_023766 [Tyrophagus putrescentiae]|nr:hypothetical protein TYRP_023766 [Tyrophagus putrescentiae]
MEIPVTTTTASSSSLGDQTVSDSPNSLTTQPSEMLTQIADFLPLTEQLRLRGQVGNHRLLNFITEFLSEKRKLMLKINYLPYETIYGSMTKFLMMGCLNKSASVEPQFDAFGRRFSPQRRLPATPAAFLTSFEVVSISNDTESLEIAAAALASFLHSTHKPSDDEVENENEEEETDQQSSHIQLDSFAFYALSLRFRTNSNFEYSRPSLQDLSLTEMPPAPSVDNFTSTCTVTSSTPKTFYTTQPNSSLESLKSLTLRSWCWAASTTKMCLLFAQLSPVFPALQRLVLVLKSKETGSVKPVDSYPPGAYRPVSSAPDRSVGLLFWRAVGIAPPRE